MRKFDSAGPPRNALTASRKGVSGGGSSFFGRPEHVIRWQSARRGAQVRVQGLRAGGENDTSARRRRHVAANTETANYSQRRVDAAAGGYAHPNKCLFVSLFSFEMSQ